MKCFDKNYILNIKCNFYIQNCTSYSTPIFNLHSECLIVYTWNKISNNYSVIKIYYMWRFILAKLGGVNSKE